MASFEQLTQNLMDTSQPIATRRAAVLEIADIGGDQAVPFLLKALADVAPSVRRETANVLQRYNSPDVTTALLDAIKVEENDLTLWTLIEVLGKVGITSALPTLHDLLIATLSPLTRREIQKSVDLITARIPETDTAEPDNSPDISDTPILEVEQPGISQDTTDESVVEIEDYSDDIPLDSDELIIEDTSVPSHSLEESITPDDIEVLPIDSTEEHDQQPDKSVSEESPDSVVLSEDAEPNTQDETNSPKDLQPRENTLQKLGSSLALPVLVPNTSVVIYGEEERKFKPSIFALVLQPNAYLSKRWVSRTRIYLVLFCLLVAATIALVYSQVQRQPRSPYLPNAEIAFLDNLDDYLATGSFYIQQAKYRRAIEELELIRGVDSIDPNLYKNLGFAYFQENQYTLAVEAYEFYLQARRNKSYHPFVAEASYSSGDLGNPNNDPSDYKTYNILGTAYKQLAQLDKARQAFETAIKIAPNEPEAYSNLAQLYSNNYQQKHLLAEALAYAAVRLNPDVASYQDTLGWILSKSGRLNKAINALEQAIRLQSDYVPAIYHIAEVAQKSKHPEKAVKVIQNDFVKKMHRKRRSRQDILGVLSYIYETDAQKIPRFNSSLYRLRGVE
jgi:tetratricopeptide (TPR) repeat protein